MPRYRCRVEYTTTHQCEVLIEVNAPTSDETVRWLAKQRAADLSTANERFSRGEAGAVWEAGERSWHSWDGEEAVTVELEPDAEGAT